MFKKRTKEAQQQEKEQKSNLKSLRNEHKQQLKQEKKRQKKLGPELKKAKTAQNCLMYRHLFEDGVMEIEPGHYSKTIEFTDINYQIARKEDQENLFVRYCEMLNGFSSDVNIQLTLRNKVIDAQKFSESMLLQKQNNELDPYIDEFNSMLKEKALHGDNSVVRSRRLTYTVKAKNYEQSLPLLNRIEVEVLSNLKRLGCLATVQTGEERVNDLADTFYPNSPIHMSFNDLLYSNLHTKDFIAPASFDFSEKNTFRQGNQVAQVLYFKELPPDLNDQILSSITDISAPISISIHLYRIEQDIAVNLVKSKIAFMEQQKIDEQKKAQKSGYDPDTIPIELRYSLDEAYELLDFLQNKSQRMFRICLSVYTQADSLEQLANQSYQIQSAAAKNNCRLETLDYPQLEALNTVLPLGMKRFPIERTVLTASAGVFVPFNAQDLVDEQGFYYGLNAVTKNLIFFNRKKLQTPNGFILGMPGSGKSFAAKREITSAILGTQDEVIIIDPEREYTPLVTALGGQILPISSASRIHMNPMDMNLYYSDDDDPLLLKSEFILSLMEVLIANRNGLDAKEKSILDRCTQITYREFLQDTVNIPNPTLKDFYKVLKEQPEYEAQNMAVSLELYIEGSLSVFSNPTNVELNNRLICFDIKDLGKQLKTMGLLIVLDHIWNRITTNRAQGKNTWIFIDEIYLLFRNEYSSSFLFEFWKRVRKWGGIPTGIEQNIEVILMSETARTMLSNSGFIMMLNQASNDRDELADLLKISPTQLSYVTNSIEGQGLLYAQGAIVPFIDKFPQKTKLYQLMTTKLDELNLELPQ